MDVVKNISILIIFILFFTNISAFFLETLIPLKGLVFLIFNSIAIIVIILASIAIIVEKINDSKH
jgi:hypothetical protein